MLHSETLFLRREPEQNGCGVINIILFISLTKLQIPITSSLMNLPENHHKKECRN